MKDLFQWAVGNKVGNDGNQVWSVAVFDDLHLKGSDRLCVQAASYWQTGIPAPATGASGNPSVRCWSELSYSQLLEQNGVCPDCICFMLVLHVNAAGVDFFVCFSQYPMCICIFLRYVYSFDTG